MSLSKSVIRRSICLRDGVNLLKAGANLFLGFQDFVCLVVSLLTGGANLADFKVAGGGGRNVKNEVFSVDWLREGIGPPVGVIHAVDFKRVEVPGKYENASWGFMF